MNKFSYTLKHKIAFLKVEKQLLGKNTISGLLHDTDKLFLYIFMSKEKVHTIHRRISTHHNRAKTKKHYINMVIDWECAKITKPDKPLNARQTLYAYFPEMEKNILPILNQFNL